MACVLITLEIDNALYKEISRVCKEQGLSEQETVAKAIELLREYTEQISQSMEIN